VVIYVRSSGKHIQQKVHDCPSALSCRRLQAKKNVVSGKVFEAHEEICKTQKTVEAKEQQLQQLQAAVQHHQSQEVSLRAELEQLRQQYQHLQQQQQQQAGRGTISDPGVPQRGQLQLPIQQMLAQQQQQQQQHQAAIAALSNRGGLSESLNGSPMAAAGSSSPFAHGGGDSPASKIGRMRIDRTPPRDQDELSLTVGAN
jgi:chromosome segregation ATPase